MFMDLDNHNEPKKKAFQTSMYREKERKMLETIDR